MAKKLLAMSVALIVGGLGLVITTGTQAAHAAAALNGFNDWNALVNTDQPQTLAARTFHVSQEKTINDVRQARLVLLEGIDNAIRIALSIPSRRTNRACLTSLIVFSCDTWNVRAASVCG